MVDMHTIGAGGGSIAFIDAGGALQVGPQSAGARPGPACYAQGGTQPTVTDANLVLGYLPRDALLAGNIPLDYGLACQAMETLLATSGLDTIEEVAEGIIRIINEHMAQALRVISIQRGLDPREFVLLAFGGAGGMHVCALADALDMQKAMAPIHAGVLSAMGMLVAPAGRQLSRTLGQLLRDCTDASIINSLEELTEKAKRALSAEGISPDKLIFSPSLDLCYRGQSFTLNIKWQNIVSIETAFHTLHESRFGHRLDMPVELVNIRMGVTADAEEIKFQAIKEQFDEKNTYGDVYDINESVTIWSRVSLTDGQIINGPAIITDEISTTFVTPNWRCRVDQTGNLMLDKLDYKQ
jgi:N-methylhydantoinase A